MKKPNISALPWVIGKNVNGTDKEAIIAAGSTPPIIVAWVNRPPDMKFIEAAPDMAAALEESVNILARLEWYLDGQKDGVGVAPSISIRAQISKIRDVLIKAGYVNTECQGGLPENEIKNYPG